MNGGGADIIRGAFASAEEVVPETAGGGRDLKLARKPLNDSGNGERFRARYQKDLRFVPQIGRLFFAGTHWSAETGDQRWALAADRTAKAMREGEAAALAEAGADDKQLEAFRKWANRSGNLAQLEAMQAVSEPFLTVRIAELDAAPFLLNVENGTLELGRKAGSKTERAAVRLRRHARTDLITRVCAVAHEAEAQCPRFRQFLDYVLPDSKVQEWLQRFLGYALTGDAREHVLVFLLGEGRNGKGTLIRLLSWLLGDYAATISFASLAADDRRRGSEASPDIARLPGVRLLFAAEPKKGAKLDDGRVKELTGEDRQLARHLNRGFFEFDPKFKLVIQANNRPRIADTSAGMWERVRLVPFDVVIPAEERDEELLDKLKAEGSGVLNWLLDGYRLWAEQGLKQTPEAIVAATAKYRGDSDELGRFLAMATKPGDGIPSSQLFACYQGWAKAMDLRPMSLTRFGEELGKRGHSGEQRGARRLIWRAGLAWGDAIDWEWELPIA